jgi:hypothetical protein
MVLLEVQGYPHRRSTDCHCGSSCGLGRTDIILNGAKGRGNQVGNGSL